MTDTRDGLERLVESWKRERESLSDKQFHYRAKERADCIKELEAFIENYVE